MDDIEPIRGWRLVAVYAVGAVVGWCILIGAAWTAFQIVDWL